MNQKIKSHKLFSVFLGTGLALGLLFYAMFHASAAAAHTTSNPLAESASLFTHTPLSGAALQASSVATYYMPIIWRNTLVYQQNFDSSDNNWPKGDDGSCASVTSGGRYQLTIDADKECFRFAPSAAERTFGEFEVLLYHSGEFESNSALGIYINGNGNSNYYLFRIWPNNSCTNGGRFDFIRRKDGNSVTIVSETCNLNIKKGYGAAAANILKVRHTSDRVITLYINGVQIRQFVENAGDERTGKGTGVYGRNGSTSKDVILKYDDFKVYAP